jgi:hypothetical protein
MKTGRHLGPPFRHIVARPWPHRRAFKAGARLIAMRRFHPS